MGRILDQAQLSRLAQLLRTSGRVSTSYKRHALLEEIGYDPNRIAFDTGAAGDFAFVFLGQLNRQGDRATLQRIVKTILAYLPADRSDLLDLHRTLAEDPTDIPEPKPGAKTLSRAVIRIWNTAGKVIGSGFLVDERRVLTCAHVVTNALGVAEDTAEPPDATLTLDFPLLAAGETLAARVSRWAPAADVAGLQLLGFAPPTASPAHLIVATDELWGHQFRAFGFPRGRCSGVWTSGVIRGRQADGWIQIEDTKGTGYLIEPGFSGSPVWDEALGGVLGMIVAADSNAQRKAAYFLAGDVLVQTWPEHIHTRRTL